MRILKNILVILIIFIFSGCSDGEKKLREKIIVLEKENEFLKNQQEQLNLNKTQKDKALQAINIQLEEQKKNNMDLEKKLLEAQYKFNENHKKEIEEKTSKEYKLYLIFLFILLLISIFIIFYLYKNHNKRNKKLEEVAKDKEDEIKLLKDKFISLEKEKEKLENSFKTTEQNRIIELINGYKERRLFELKEICSNN